MTDEKDVNVVVEDVESNSAIGSGTVTANKDVIVEREIGMEIGIDPGAVEGDTTVAQEGSVEKTLNNSDVECAKEQVGDLEVFGNGDMFQLLCKASSKSEGWMKSTKAMVIPKVGCLVQVTTQQKNIDGTYSIAEALSFVPGATIVGDAASGRRLAKA